MMTARNLHLQKCSRKLPRGFQVAAFVVLAFLMIGLLDFGFTKNNPMLIDDEVSSGVVPPLGCVIALPNLGTGREGRGR